MQEKTTLNPGYYRHYKGNDYQVIGVATHSESGDALVVYRPLYGEGALWVRPLDMFVEQVQVDGKSVPRFAWLGEAPSSSQ
ncbi:MAG: DUF1653 domain-containing protein [Alcanivoracaceae bacterium]|nr:DUF1653 domain-containing protein [Alcanivoracaceae bacterium]